LSEMARLSIFGMKLWINCQWFSMGIGIYKLPRLSSKISSN
jgi:hypothetical protein